MSMAKTVLSSVEELVEEVENQFPAILEHEDGHHAVQMAVTATRCAIAGLGSESLLAQGSVQKWAGKVDGYHADAVEAAKTAARNAIIQEVEIYLADKYTTEEYEVVPD